MERQEYINKIFKHIRNKYGLYKLSMMMDCCGITSKGIISAYFICDIEPYKGQLGVEVYVRDEDWGEHIKQYAVSELEDEDVKSLWEAIENANTKK